MNSLPDYFIIFDTEYTAWEESQKNNWNKQNEYMELVQIGALKIRKNKNKLEILDKISILIKPKINPILSKYFINLTQITQNELNNNSYSFEDGMKIFYDFCFYNNKNISLYSYGNDYSIILYNLDLYKKLDDSVYRLWKKHFYDIKNIFKNYIDVNKYSSGTLYTAFNINPDNNISIHNALWDSMSLFLSLNHLDKIEI